MSDYRCTVYELDLYKQHQTDLDESYLLPWTDFLDDKTETVYAGDGYRSG